MKIIQLLILLSFILNFSCTNRRVHTKNHKTDLESVKNTRRVSNIDKNITWYQQAEIWEIRKIDEKKYLIQIGISAQRFYLDSKLENVYKILNYSLKNNKSIKIGIENNTHKILFANKLNQ